MIPIELLYRFPFFSVRSDKELKAIAMIAQEVSYEPGDVVFETNTPADSLYFLITGHLPYYIVVTSENVPDYRKEYFVGYINPEEIFGISASRPESIALWRRAITAKPDDAAGWLALGDLKADAATSRDAYQKAAALAVKPAQKQLALTKLVAAARSAGDHNAIDAAYGERRRGLPSTGENV